MDVLLVSNVCLFKTCDVYFFFNEKEAVPALLNNSVRPAAAAFLRSVRYGTQRRALEDAKFILVVVE